MAKIPQEEKDKGIVLCGDLIDRGPRSMQVVEFVKNTPNIQTVMGNHEDMMIKEGLQEMGSMMKNGYTSRYGIWVMNGGNKCLDSYMKNGKFDSITYLEHIDWMKELPIYLEFKNITNNKGRYLVVSHSAVHTSWKKRDTSDNYHFKQNLLWGRPQNIKDNPKIFNVFGHTPIPGARIRTSYANIDTGAFYKEEGYYHLTALQFPEMKIYTQDNIDND